MKPTKEQIKIVFKKILFWQREQKNKEENNFFEKDKIDNKETHNNISVPDNIPVENEKLTIKERYNQIPQSEKAKMMFQILKRDRLNKEKQSETPPFKNEQMLLHLYDVCEAIQLKFSQESISTDKNLIINFKNQSISIEPSLVEFAFAYEELNKTFRLEAKTLIEEMILRMGDGYSHVPESLIVDFFNEILKEKKFQIEKEAFKRKIVWLKK